MRIFGASGNERLAMTHFVSQKLKAAFSYVGLRSRDQGHPFYSDSEIASLRQSARAISERAMELEQADEPGIHPRVAQLRAQARPHAA